MKKRIALLIMLLISIICMSGCWDYTEYENLAQVVGIGVDFDNSTKETTMTHQYLVPKSTKGSDSLGASSTKTGLVYSAKGKTGFDALSKLQQVLMKRIFYGYLKVYVLGEETAKYDLMENVELNDRSPLIRDTAYFVVASGDAQKILSTVDENTAKTSSEIIFGLVNNAKSTGAAFPVTIHDVTEMLAIGGWELTAPRVISTAQDIKSEAGETQDGMFLSEKSKGGLIVSGMAAFKGDKFVGWLNEKESTGLGLIMGKKITMYEVSQRPAGSDPADILYFSANSCMVALVVLNSLRIAFQLGFDISPPSFREIKKRPKALEA
jgi:spore germination protein KC